MQANAVTHYRYSPAPSTSRHRFLVTDVGSGLVGMVVARRRWRAFRRRTIDAVVQIAGALTKRNFFEEGRNLRNLGLEGKTVEQIMAFVTSLAFAPTGRWRGAAMSSRLPVIGRSAAGESLGA